MTLHLLWRAASSHGQQFVSDITHFVKGNLITYLLWPTESEWYHTFCERQSHHIFCCDQQQVSDIAYFYERQYLFLWPTASEQYCALLWNIFSPHLFLWITASKWHCTLLWSSLTVMPFHDLQKVSDIPLKGSFITSCVLHQEVGILPHLLYLFALHIIIHRL